MSKAKRDRGKILRRSAYTPSRARLRSDEQVRPKATNPGLQNTRASKAISGKRSRTSARASVGSGTKGKLKQAGTDMKEMKAKELEVTTVR